MDAFHVPRSHRHALCAIFTALLAAACSQDRGAPQFVSSNPMLSGERRILVGFVVAGDQLYWAMNACGADFCTGAVFTEPKSGGPARQLADKAIWGLVTNGADVYWSQGGWIDPVLLQWLAPGARDPVTIPTPAQVDELAARGPLLYAGLLNQSLVAVPQDGGASETLLSDAGFFEAPSPMVADETGLSWFDGIGVTHLSPSGTVPQRLASVKDPQGLVSAAGALWYFDSPVFADAGTLFRIPAASGPPEAVLQTGPIPQGLAGDATGLAWVELGPAGEFGPLAMDGGAVVHGSLDGGVLSMVSRIRTPGQLMQAVAIDEAWVYFVVEREGRDEIWRVRRD